MFEGCNVPALASVLNLNDIEVLNKPNCLQVHVGHNTTHVVPRLGNRYQL